VKIEKKPDRDQLFNRIVSILEEARANVAQSVNTNMVVAYWLIGHEIVQELQQGEGRAEYGKRTIESLSKKLTKRFGSGFSEQSLQNFRRFYKVYPGRLSISSLSGRELHATTKVHPAGGEFINLEKNYMSGGELTSGFYPRLSWSHYRALMRVKKDEAREFYEQESIDCGWSKTQLERQIQTSYYERILSNHGKQGLLPAGRERLPGEAIDPTHVLKSPTVLEFLGLPDSTDLHESSLEQVIIAHLQKFLLELGKGFAFVARQKRLVFDEKTLYVDLVFYNCILKCYLLIDLKMGELSHKDVGQMDGYVRMFDDLYTADDDNPTIGLVLCTKKNEAVAKYSVLNERKQIFASKYLLYLPSEEELQLELQKERKLIEVASQERD